MKVVALFSRLPPKLIEATPVSFHTPPELMVTFPVNVLFAVLSRIKVPEIVVAPPTVNVQVFVAPVAKVAPVLIVNGAVPAIV